MRAGALRYRGSIQAIAKARDDHGAQTIAWVTVLPTVRFSLEATGGVEKDTAGSIRAQSRYNASMRYFAAIQPGMRLITGDRKLSIVSVNDPTGLRRELLLVVDEGVSIN